MELTTRKLPHYRAQEVEPSSTVAYVAYAPEGTPGAHGDGI